MALSDGPYYEKPTQKSRSCDRYSYPDILPTTAPSLQTLSLNGGVLPLPQGDRQLNGLLKAITAAGSQDSRFLQDAVQGVDELESISTPLGMIGRCGNEEQGKTHVRQLITGDSITTEFTRKRKRNSGPTTSEGEAGSAHPATKGSSTARASAYCSNGEDISVPAQSAAALFRSPGTSSRKYTRPPMSKLYTSLELDPEKFLELQAAAKTYMLDPDHPDRRECVGQRGKGDSEVVKMKLWNTVARFLDEEGHGYSHFGSQVLVEQGLERSMIWPQDKSRIIGTVMPLLRRMVTNERQRQYAVETRKGGSSSSTRSLENAKTQQALSEDPGHPVHGELIKPAGNTQQSGTSQPGATLQYYDEVQLRFNMIRNNQRISPPYELTAKECPDLQTVFLKALPYLSGRPHNELQIRVLMPSGLTLIQDDDDWIKALNQVGQVEWMDNEMKVLIEACEASPVPCCPR
ncbi:MAG: hypothetical protein Q9195_004450 [Heterodermia aff. obscurata]